MSKKSKNLHPHVLSVLRSPYFVLYNKTTVLPEYKFETSNFSSEPEIEILVLEIYKRFSLKSWKYSSRGCRVVAKYTKLTSDIRVVASITRNVSVSRRYINLNDGSILDPKLYVVLYGFLF